MREARERGEEEGGEEKKCAEKDEETRLGVRNGGEFFGEERAESGCDEERGNDGGGGEDGAAEEGVGLEDEGDFNGHETGAERGEVEEDAELAAGFPAEAQERKDDADDGEREEDAERDGDGE